VVSTRLRLRLRTRLPSEVIRGHQTHQTSSDVVGGHRRPSEAPIYLPRLGDLGGEIARHGAPVVEEHGAEVLPGDETGNRLLWGREEAGGRRGELWGREEEEGRRGGPLHAGCAWTMAP